MTRSIKAMIAADPKAESMPISTPLPVEFGSDRILMVPSMLCKLGMEVSEIWKIGDSGVLEI